MAAAAILNFFPVAIFNTPVTSHCCSQLPYKISCQYLNPRLNYNNYLNINSLSYLFEIQDCGRPTHEDFSLGHQPVKFYANPMRSFEDMGF